MTTMQWLLMALSAASVGPAIFAFLFSLYAARRSVAARRRITALARKNAKVLHELHKAYMDRHIDDAEVRAVLRALRKAIEDDDHGKRKPENMQAKMFIRELDPHRNRRMIEDLAREVELIRLSA